MLKHPTLVLVTLMMGTSMAAIDSSIVNVSLPVAAVQPLPQSCPACCRPRDPGYGRGAVTPTSLAILSESFPEEKRGSVIGWWGLGNVMGPALGPTLGGVLTQYFGWESVFYVNIPIGIATILMTYRYLTFLCDRPWTPKAFDFRGFAWLSLFIVTLQIYDIDHR